MQNKLFTDKHLIKIEKIIYQFIWKGKDRIKRETLKKGYAEGGLKAPNIYNINKMCKIKQVLRSSQSLHPIAQLQGIQLDLTQLTHPTHNIKDEFLRQGVQGSQHLHHGNYP